MIHWSLCGGMRLEERVHISCLACFDLGMGRVSESEGHFIMISSCTVHAVDPFAL